MTDNKSTLLIANDYISRGDHEGFLSFCTEDVVWEFVGDQVLRGKSAVRKYMETVYAEPPEFEVQELLGDHEHVVAVGLIQLKESNGRTASFKYCDVWKFRGGKMASLKAFVVEVN